MQKGDKVYAAWIDYGGRVEVQEATLTSVEPAQVKITGDRLGAFRYKRAIPCDDVLLGRTREVALDRLRAQCERSVEYARQALATACDERDLVLAAIAKEKSGR